MPEEQLTQIEDFEQAYPSEHGLDVVRSHVRMVANGWGVGVVGCRSGGIDATHGGKALDDPPARECSLSVGMRTVKKAFDLLSASRLLAERRGVPVVRIPNGRIVWVAEFERTNDQNAQEDTKCC